MTKRPSPFHLLLLLLLLPLLPFLARATSSPEDCLDGQFFASNECLTCPDERWCREGDQCRRGHKGYACMACEEKWFFRAKAGVCKACPVRRDAVYAYGATVIGIIVFCLIMYWTESGHDVTTFCIVTTHFQLVFIFFALPFYYPPTIQFATGPIGIFSGFIFSILTDWAEPECTGIGGSDYAFWWCAAAFGPLFLLLPLLIRGATLHYAQQRSAARDKALPEAERVLSYREYKRRRRVAYWKKHCVQNILIVQTLIFMHGVSMAIGVWHCRRGPDGALRLAQQAAIECSWRDDADYRKLLSASVAVFLVYFLGTFFCIFSILESGEGRRAAALHHVTHARLLRDVTLWQQVVFVLGMLVYGGERYGRRRENARLWSRVRLYFRLIVALRKGDPRQQQQQRGEGSIVDPEVKQREYALSVDVTNSFLKGRNYCPPPLAKAHSEAFPVFVQKKRATGTMTDWVKGIFHREDSDGRLLVATGSKEDGDLSLDGYDSAHLIFENGRMVEMTDDIQKWTNQEVREKKCYFDGLLIIQLSHH
jgi:hypothetical protein